MASHVFVTLWREQQVFYKIVQRILRCMSICKNSGWVMRVDGCDSDIVFDVDSVDIQWCGCGQCGVKYPGATLTGTSWDSATKMPFEAHASTWGFYSCNCEDGARDTPPTEMLFKFYPESDFGHWIQVWLTPTNIKCKVRPANPE